MAEKREDNSDQVKHIRSAQPSAGTYTPKVQDGAQNAADPTPKEVPIVKPKPPEPTD